MNEKVQTTELESKTWVEYRLIFSDASVNRDWVKDNYIFIKESLIPLVDKLCINSFHVLNYFDQSKGEDFIRFRVDVSPEVKAQIENELYTLKKQTLIQDFTQHAHNPRQDAEQRIKKVHKYLEVFAKRQVKENWTIVGINEGTPIFHEKNEKELNEKLDAFESFLSHVLGQWTKTFVKEMKSKPEDMWLISVFVHLALNSITCHQGQESAIRNIPYW